MMKKMLSGALAMLMLLLVLSACGNNAQTKGPKENASDQKTGGKIQLTFWHGYSPDKEAVLKDYIKKYESEHPNVEIKEQFIANGEDMLTKLQAGLSTNQLPDISWGFPTWTGALASSGKLVDVGSLMDSQMKKDFFSGVLDANRYQGKIYSLPIEAGALELIYNKDKFKAAGIKEAPKTWDELLAAAKKLTHGDQYGIYIPVQPDERTTWTWETFLWQNGGQLVKNGKVAFGNSQGAEALKFYTDLVTKYKVAPKDKIDVDAAFTSGKLAMVIGTQGAASGYQSKNNMNIGVAPLPSKKESATGLGTNTLFLFKSNSAKEKAAWDFVKWLTNTENNADWAIKMGYLPVRQSAVNSSKYQQFGKENPASLVAAESLSSGVTRPNDEYYPKMSDAISNAIGKIIYNGTDVKDALAEAVKTSNAVMSN
jgi:ABC-type glycerol-3-phosphate transport system substrate-binding protein